MIAVVVPHRAAAFCALIVALAACAPTSEQTPPAAAASASAPAVTRRPLPEVTPPPPATSPAPAASAPMPPIVVPAGALYVCAVRTGATLEQTAIEYAEKVGQMCRKHPEMGPCQYERNACRRKGGRVFAADGTEITMVTEAEYDKKVRRVTFKAN
ncbi:MAG: hypothetical protein ABWZ29_03010 [Casimicrobiaceae bacterium]